MSSGDSGWLTSQRTGTAAEAADSADSATSAASVAAAENGTSAVKADRNPSFTPSAGASGGAVSGCVPPSDVHDVHANRGIDRDGLVLLRVVLLGLVLLRVGGFAPGDVLCAARLLGAGSGARHRGLAVG